MAYSSPEYDEQKYRQGVDTSAYSNFIKTYTDAQEKNRASQIADAQKTQQSALKQAYVQKLQNQKALDQNLASSGIRGGATETSNLKLANTYANARNSANTDYSNSVNSINKAVDENILNYTMDMNSRAEERIQNVADAKWQAAREDYANAVEYETQANETQIQALADQYSRLSNSQLKKLIAKKGLTAQQQQALGRVRTARGF